MSLVPPLSATPSAYPLPGTAPVPAAGEYVLAENIQECTQALLNQDAALEAKINKTTHYYADSAGASVGTARWDAPANIGGLVDVDSTVVVLDVESCEEDDVLLIAYSTNARIEGTTAAAFELKPVVIEDYGGAGTVRVPDPSIVLTGADQDEFGGLAVISRHVVITPGDARVMVRATIANSTGIAIRTIGHWSIRVDRIRP